MAEYRPNRAGWNAIAVSPEIQAACLAVAAEGKAFAVGISPRSGDGQGAPYADSFEVNAKTVTGGQFSPRAAAELRNTAPHAAAVEYGNSARRQADRVLGRTEAFLTGGA